MGDAAETREKIAQQDISGVLNAADPFIDHDGYLRYIESGEEAFRKALTEQQHSPSWITRWIP